MIVELFFLKPIHLSGLKMRHVVNKLPKITKKREVLPIAMETGGN